MSNSFGPWTTGIDANASQHLSTFWKRRLTMLPDVSKSPMTPTRRQVLQLGTLGLGLAAWPTLRLGGAVESSTAPVGQDDRAGHLYLFAQFESLRKGNEGNEGNEEVGGIIAVDPESGDWEQLRPLGFSIFSISPDGTKLASGDFESRDGYAWLTNVWIVDLNRPDAEPRTVCPFGDWSIWSGDGSELIVPLRTSEPGEKPRQWEHWRMNADGTDRAKLPLPDSHLAIDWSPDGRWLATVSHDHPDAQGNHVYIMRPDGTEPRRMSSEDISAHARFSPDSRQLAFPQRGVLIALNLDGSDPQELYQALEHGVSIAGTAWSPDGRQLACVIWDYDRDQKVLRRPLNNRILIVNVEDKTTRTLRIPDAFFSGGIYWI